MTIHIDSNDIWIKIKSIDHANRDDSTTDYDSVTKDDNEFIARLGCGGAISNILDTRTGQELLSPSFRDEKTDRIIQWTLWSNSLINPISHLPEFEWRYNITQGGDFDGQFSDTRHVNIDSDEQKNTIDIFSTPTLNWKKEQQGDTAGGTPPPPKPPRWGDTAWPHRQADLGQGDTAWPPRQADWGEGDTTRSPQQADWGGIIPPKGLNSLTTYKISNKIQITRILKPYGASEIGFGDTYLEAWNPLSNTTFKNIALSFDSTNPKWWYNLTNLPTYPNWFATETKGYFVAFNETTSPAMAIVFGRSPLLIHQINGETKVEPTVVNSMTWDTGFGLLPAIKIPNWTKDGLLIVSYFILLNYGITENFIKEIETTANICPAPVYYENSSLAPELAKKLDDSLVYPPVATDHLGSFVSRSRNATALIDVTISPVATAKSKKTCVSYLSSLYAKWKQIRTK